MLRPLLCTDHCGVCDADRLHCRLHAACRGVQLRVASRCSLALDEADDMVEQLINTAAVANKLAQHAAWTQPASPPVSAAAVAGGSGCACWHAFGLVRVGRYYLALIGFAVFTVVSLLSGSTFLSWSCHLPGACELAHPPKHVSTRTAAAVNQLPKTATSPGCHCRRRPQPGASPRAPPWSPAPPSQVLRSRWCVAPASPHVRPVRARIAPPHPAPRRDPLALALPAMMVGFPSPSRALQAVLVGL